MGKYGSSRGNFQEPVLRCDRCEKLILGTDIHLKGMCPHCGNRRVRSLAGYTLMEYIKMRWWWQVDPDFFREFQKA